MLIPGLGGLSTKLIIAAVIVGGLVGLWFHYQGLHDEIAQLEGDKRQLETAVDLKDQEIAVMQDQGASRRERAQEGAQRLWTARAKVSALEAKLSRHDLGTAIASKPEWLTKIMQKGTRKRLKSIEGAANATLE